MKHSRIIAADRTAMNPLTHLSLFSGIGGIDLAAHWAGFETVAFCEQAKFPQEVLRQHWPDVPIFDDITTLTADELQRRGTPWPALITGGFPCQPFSAAGKRRGKDDDRHLWPHMLRIIEEVRPTWVVGENVAGFVSMVQFDQTLAMADDGAAIGEIGDVVHRMGRGIADETMASLEQAGYEVQPVVIPACGVGALHQRARIFILAHTERGGREAWGPATGRQARTPAHRLRSGGRREDVADTGCVGGDGLQSIQRAQCSEEATAGGGGEDAPDATWDERGRQEQRAQRQRTGESGESIATAISDASCERCDGNESSRRGRAGLADESFDDADADRSRLQGHRRLDECGDEWLAWTGSEPFDRIWESEPPVGRVAHGIPRRVDRLKGLGNAVVPEQIYPILDGIAMIERALCASLLADYGERRAA